MLQSRALRVVFCASLLATGRLVAQVSQQGSPIDDLLTKAQQAFNDLNYPRADTLARQVLGLGGRITQAQRTRALMVIAASYFPEETGAQKRTDAIAVLKQIVRSDIDVKLPQDLTWSGLDSLLADTKRTTFGLAISADSTQAVSGPKEQATVRVRSNHVAHFRLALTPVAGGAPVVSDSLMSSTSGAMHFAAMRNDRPLFTTGDYELSVLGTDAASSDTATAKIIVHVTAPELTFVNIPASIDSSKLRAERTGRYGFKGIIVGGLVGGGIYGLSNVLRADTVVKRTVAADSKGMAVAGGVGAMIVLASFLDHGREIPSAIMANQRLRDDLATSIRNTQAENANRIATYRTTIVIQTGAGR